MLPLKSTEKEIQQTLLKEIPLGTPYSKVKQALADRIQILSMNTVKGSYVLNPATGKHELVRLRIYANLGELPTGPVPVVIQVSATFDFDDKELLREVLVSKMPHGP